MSTSSDNGREHAAIGPLTAEEKRRVFSGAREFIASQESAGCAETVGPSLSNPRPARESLSEGETSPASSS